MFQPDFYYSYQGSKIPLPPMGDSLAIAYRGEVPPRDLEALVRDDDALARLTRSHLLTQHRMVLYKRGPAVRVPLGELAQRIQRSAPISYVTLVALRSGSPVVITDEFIVGFKPEVTPEAIAELNIRHGVEPVQRPNLFLGPRELLLRVKNPGPGGALPVANQYFETGLMQFTEPDFIHLVSRTFPLTTFTPNNPLFPQQWHLPQIRAQEAWAITRGDPAVIVAILDSGIEIGHDDFNRAGKFVMLNDYIMNDHDPSPDDDFDFHGTCVMGIVAADGKVAGVAPNCKFMALRIMDPLDIKETAQKTSHSPSAIRDAAAKGAAVISNSWKTTTLDGSLNTALKDVMKSGCVVVAAAGNDNGRVAFHQKLAQPGVIVVAACNDQERRSGYSNFGIEVNVCAPSDGTTAFPIRWHQNLPTAFEEDGSQKGIVTTDQKGSKRGLNAPDATPKRNDTVPEDYTSSFGGTSAACPQVAGVAALMLSVNPKLTHEQVRFLLEATAEKIDAANPDPSSHYEPNGHSKWYGFGRVNAFEAVRNARASVKDGDFVEKVTVRLQRLSKGSNRFVSTQVLLHAVDARRLPVSKKGDVFVRSGPDGFLRVTFDPKVGPLGLLVVEAEVDE
jgi:subtilisin family serine protease